MELLGVITARLGLGRKPEAPQIVPPKKVIFDPNSDLLDIFKGRSGKRVWIDGSKKDTLSGS